MGGLGEALKIDRLEEVVKRYKGMTDIFVLCVDRDGDVNRIERLRSIQDKLKDSCVFLAQNAWEELETWVLAALRLPKDWKWQEIRASIDVKERYFEPYAALRNVADGPGGGRRALGREAAKRVDLIREKCPEDFGHLADSIADALALKGY